ncbi:hypothetical protein EK904_014739 [Melospiza melodia maxima]|nr:hypothetical protein EK904_014739 [Melospiza melodia maxima]
MQSLFLNGAKLRGLRWTFIFVTFLFSSTSQMALPQVHTLNFIFCQTLIVYDRVPELQGRVLKLVVKSKGTFVGAVNIQLSRVQFNEEKWYPLGNSISALHTPRAPGRQLELEQQRLHCAASTKRRCPKPEWVEVKIYDLLFFWKESWVLQEARLLRHHHQRELNVMYNTNQLKQCQVSKTKITSTLDQANPPIDLCDYVITSLSSDL